MSETYHHIELYNEASIEAEHLIRKHKLRQLDDFELTALIDLLLFERNCRAVAVEQTN